MQCNIRSGPAEASDSPVFQEHYQQHQINKNDIFVSGRGIACGHVHVLLPRYLPLKQSSFALSDGLT